MSSARHSVLIMSDIQFVPRLLLQNPGGLAEVCVGKDEAGKPYKYGCLAKDFENMETISEIEMKAIFEIPNLCY